MAGIWYCLACGVKFAGKSYTQGAKPILKPKVDKFETYIETAKPEENTTTEEA